MPKCDRNGQANTWSDHELNAVLEDLSPSMRSLFSICRYTGCRVSEARQLQAEDVVGHHIVFRKATTKGQRTRQVAMHDTLRQILTVAELPTTGYLFPGRGDRPISRQACDKALRQACDRLGFVGFSTHSFRRTVLTRLSNAGVPLRVIQEISGHRSLQELQRYLEVRPDQIEGAIAKL